MTSHAAVVVRGMGMPCVSGCNDIVINIEKGLFKVDNKIIKKDDFITIDGGSGNVFEGKIPTIEPKMSDDFKLLLSWADDIRKMGVYANADTPEDAKKARDLGAEGIGLCRTEHMFMASERLPLVQAMILADNKKSRQSALEKLKPMQRDDFYKILKEMNGLPVIIRLLDPPLHEFLPNYEETIVKVTTLKLTNDDSEEYIKEKNILERIEKLKEMNQCLVYVAVDWGYFILKYMKCK